MFKKVITKPYFFFFGLTAVFVVLGTFNNNKPIDINISFVHYLINIDFWCYISALFFTLIGINYLTLNWVKRQPNKILVVLHLLLQISSLVPFLFAIFSYDQTGSLPKNNMMNVDNLQYILLIALILFLTSIFIHFIVFFSSIFLKSE